MPSLLTENGPNAGERYELTEAEVIVGRHPECDIVVDVGAVSRQHAKFVKNGAHYMIEDLGSRNGTYVNGDIVRGRQSLREGDKVQVCDISFVYGQPAAGTNTLLRDDEPSSILMEDRPGDNSRVMSRLDIVGSGTGSISIATSSDAKLKALMEISRNLSRSLAIEEVLPLLLDSLFQLFVQADRGFIILRDEEGQLIPRWSKQRRDDDARVLRISKTIIQEVVEKKQAIWSTDTSGDQRFALSDSIADFRIRSFVCAPLVDAEDVVLGAIQLDSLDHRNQFRDEDLELLAVVAGQAAIAVDNAHLHEQVVRRHVLERDLALAQEVQRGYLPHNPPKIAGYQLNDLYQPADKVGGDYYDYIELPDGRTAVILADVVGHGMAAALQTAQLSVAIRFSLAAKSDPAQAIEALNETLMESSLDDRFITFVMMVLYPNSDKVSIVNAGHNPPLLCRGNDLPIELGSEVRNLALLIDSISYETVDVTLQEGDHVVLYTDGLNESMNAAGELYGIDRMREQMRGIAGGDELVKNLIKDINRFLDGELPKDDMCLVCCSHTSSP